MIYYECNTIQIVEMNREFSLKILFHFAERNKETNVPVQMEN
jgi:hypothetical protein